MNEQDTLLMNRLNQPPSLRQRMEELLNKSALENGKFPPQLLFAIKKMKKDNKTQFMLNCVFPKH
jgi:uncharacterized protein (DUF1778 family)